MDIDQLWNFLLTPTGILVSIIITFGVIGIYAYLTGQFKD